MDTASANIQTTTHKYALVIGNNRGHDPEKTLYYAERDARKLFDLLRELGGFRAENTTLLTGATADEAWQALRDLERRAAANTDKPGRQSMLVIYYSGHASNDMLEMGETTLHFKELLHFLKTSAADVRLGLIDSCRSGKMVAIRGSRRGPEFEIRVTDQMKSKGYAIITSSADNEVSQESAEIRGAYFTHYLVSALRGAGDKSGDGRVTLTEAYSYAYAKTLARTSTTIIGSQHPMYEFQLEGQGDIVLTITGEADSRLTVRAPATGRLVILDSKSDAIVAESIVGEDQSVQLAVRPGRYITYLITEQNAVHSAGTVVPRDQDRSLDADDFQTIDLAVAVSKGGLFLQREPEWYHRLSVGGLWRLWGLEGATNSYGATIHYRVQTPHKLEPGLRFAWSTRQDTGVSEGYNDLDVLLGLGYVFSWRLVALRFGAYSGYEFMFQNAADELYYTSGFLYQGAAGLEVPIGQLLALLDVNAGGRIFQLYDQGWEHRLDLQAILGLGWKWSHR